MISRSLLIIPLLLAFTSVAQSAVLQGKLTGAPASGYKVLALQQDGRTVRTQVPPRGVFKITAKNGSTLHLVNSQGRYAGPVVFPAGRKAYTRLNGKSGNIGTVKIRNGFATVTATGQKLFNLKTSVPFNNKTGTAGSGKLGLARAVAAKAMMPLNIRAAQSTPGGDGDKDGIPNVLDIDQNGDGELDATSTVSMPPAPLSVRAASTLRGTLESGLNAHFAQITSEQIDTALMNGLILGYSVRNEPSSNLTINAVNVDCLGLPYCSSATATATIRTDALREKEGTPWLDYDPDGDGYPNLASQTTEPSTPFYIGIRPHASRDSLRPGDTILFNLTTGTGKQSLPVVLPFFFVTVPALKEYVSGATVGSISYPASANTEGSSMGNPIQLESTSLALTFFKPQRPPIEGAETGSFIDIGHLEYKLSLFAFGSNNVIFCEPSDFTAHSATLEPHTTPMGYAYFSDTADDVPYAEGTPLSLTFDAGACLSRHGINITKVKFGVDINADSQQRDQTSQTVYFQLP